MSSVATPKITAPVAKTRALPLLVYFEEEHSVRAAISTIARFRRTTFADAQRISDEVDRVVVCSSEQALMHHQEVLRKPNTRVLALTSHRFREPRVDALVYAYLPEETPTALIER